MEGGGLKMPPEPPVYSTFIVEQNTNYNISLIVCKMYIEFSTRFYVEFKRFEFSTTINLSNLVQRYLKSKSGLRPIQNMPFKSKSSAADF